MGRKPVEAMVQDKPAIDSELVMGKMALVIQAEADVRASVLALARDLGYEGALDPDVLESGIQGNQQRVQFEMFEAGKRLLLLREQCEHGNFLMRLERLDILPRAAQKFMQATLKFSNAPSTAHLAGYGKTKLLELLVLDDEEITELTQGGSARGITLDAAAKMTVSELRKALREADASLAAKTRVLGDKETTISGLQEQLALTQHQPKGASEALPTPDSLISAALDDLDGQVREITNLIISPLRSEISKLSAPALAIGDVLRQQAIRAAVGRVLAAARQVALDFDVPITGAEAADEQGEWDGIWSAALADFDSARALTEDQSGEQHVTEA